MQEIKAYVRRDEINDVVERLRRAGAPGVSVIEIHPVGYGYAANPFEPHGAKLVDRLLQIIQASCTGSPGDGMVFVSEIVEAVRIRDGARDERALQERPADDEITKVS